MSMNPVKAVLVYNNTIKLNPDVVSEGSGKVRISLTLWRHSAVFSHYKNIYFLQCHYFENHKHSMLVLFHSALNASCDLEFSCSVNIAAKFIPWKK